MDETYLTDQADPADETRPKRRTMTFEADRLGRSLKWVSRKLNRKVDKAALTQEQIDFLEREHRKCRPGRGTRVAERRRKAEAKKAAKAAQLSLYAPYARPSQDPNAQVLEGLTIAAKALGYNLTKA